MEKLHLVLKVLGTFKSYYLEYKARSAVQVPANPWRVQNGALFGRLDAFLARCQDVLELCNTGQEVRWGRGKRPMVCCAILWEMGERCLVRPGLAGPWLAASSTLTDRARVSHLIPPAPFSSQTLLTHPPQFNRLERVDIGGARGRLLTHNVRSVHSDFQQAAQRFHQVWLCVSCLWVPVAMAVQWVERGIVQQQA